MGSNAAALGCSAMMALALVSATQSQAQNLVLMPFCRSPCGNKKVPSGKGQGSGRSPNQHQAGRSRRATAVAMSSRRLTRAISSPSRCTTQSVGCGSSLEGLMSPRYRVAGGKMSVIAKTKTMKDTTV
jgi:hypothetical protein